ncbi:MAG TPA: adenosyl-hopene transferase HpnH [candidate division Zixibacteria bacterium]|nr:adenosyl-hopene transferase HpnH [candidate division Zixibacteria bacterium]
MPIHPLRLQLDLAKYIIGQKMKGVKRFPLVMMLEPLHACNLTCTGCGRIREYEDTIKEIVPVEQCLEAAEECGAPMVSICGGEPLIYKEIGRLTAELLKRKKHVILCTNGMFLTKKINEFKPDLRFIWNIHLDGLRKSHDLAVERDGVFDMAVEGIKVAKSKGFRVMTNTTVYEETDMNEIEALFEFLRGIGVDSHVVSPGYSYSAVPTKEIFLNRKAIREKFKDIKRLAKKYPIADSPIYLEFLAGDRELSCTAWGNPTYNTKGWKGPCYLITDAHHQTFGEFINDTPWEHYGHGKDPRCEDCLVHSGYEASAATASGFSDTWKLLGWSLFG